MIKIANHIQTRKITESSMKPTEKLKEAKELLAMGLIAQDDFDKIKIEVLALLKNEGSSSTRTPNTNSSQNRTPTASEKKKMREEQQKREEEHKAEEKRRKEEKRRAEKKAEEKRKRESAKKKEAAEEKARVDALPDKITIQRSYIKTIKGWFSTKNKTVQVQFPMQKIPADSFWMGALNKDAKAGKTERPRHRVTLSRGFWIGVYPCTQDLYESVMGKNPSHFKGLKRPVEKVSWCDAILFCNKLSELEGLESCYEIPSALEKACIAQSESLDDTVDELSQQVQWQMNKKGYRLPTEAEWEYCARAGQNTIYSGSDQLDEVAWHKENSRGKTHPVGEKKANGFGLYDMTGNVWEWIFDCGWRDYKGSVTDPLSSKEDLGGHYRNKRGAGVSNGVTIFRITQRFGERPSYRRVIRGEGSRQHWSEIGFRFVRNL